MTDTAAKAAAESIVLFHTECYAMGPDKESERRFIVDATNQIQDVVDDAVAEQAADIEKLKKQLDDALRDAYARNPKQLAKTEPCETSARMEELKESNARLRKQLGIVIDSEQGDD